MEQKKKQCRDKKQADGSNSKGNQKRFYRVKGEATEVIQIK